MLKNQGTRRFLVALLVLLGAALIFLATEAWTGVILITLGILIEAIGIAMRHK